MLFTLLNNEGSKIQFRTNADYELIHGWLDVIKVLKAKQVINVSLSTLVPELQIAEAGIRTDESVNR